MKELYDHQYWYKEVPDYAWFLPEDRAEREGKEVADHFFTHPGMTVFDCPCGDGRISIHLARRGASVTGIDMNPRFLEMARERFSKEGLDGHFYVRDMREAQFSGGCDLFLSWFNSFGYFPDEENRKFMHTIADCIKPGGKLVIENPIRYNALDPSQLSLDPDCLKAELDETDRFVWVMRDRETEGEFYISEALYTKEEYESMFKECGMKLTEAYSEGFTPYSDDKDRMILVAEKL